MSSLQRRIARLLYRWHRLLGVAVALFILLLAVTGVMLTHSDALGLARHHVTVRPLLAWYGIKTPQHISYFAAGSHYLSQWDDRLMFDANDIGSETGHLRGAVTHGDEIVVALDDRLLLLLGDGQLLDVLDAQSGIPRAIQRIGSGANGTVVVEADDGTWLGDSELSHWQPGTAGEVAWSQPATPPEPLRADAEARYLGEGLPLERVVEDLHSGRLFTRHGPWLMDLVALILIFSTLSGLWLWWRNHTRPRHP